MITMAPEARDCLTHWNPMHASVISIRVTDAMWKGGRGRIRVGHVEWTQQPVTAQVFDDQDPHEYARRSSTLRVAVAADVAPGTQILAWMVDGIGALRFIRGPGVLGITEPVDGHERSSVILGAAEADADLRALLR